MTDEGYGKWVDLDPPVNPLATTAETQRVRSTQPAPCQHYWLQYMEAVDPLPGVEYASHIDLAAARVLRPNGYFCVHCPARSDENRVVTNPEAL